LSLNGSRLTEVQQKILAVLEDGQPHTAKELMACLYDEKSDIKVLHTYIHFLRKKVRERGQDIVVEKWSNVTLWRLARSLASPYDGKK
jgi:hypothetical protein